MQLLVWNQVKNFSDWEPWFRADLPVAKHYGLSLARLWQAADDPNLVYFLMEVEDVERANAFMARPESTDTGVRSGVIDGGIQYLQPITE